MSEFEPGDVIEARIPALNEWVEALYVTSRRGAYRVTVMGKDETVLAIRPRRRSCPNTIAKAMPRRRLFRGLARVLPSHN